MRCLVVINTRAGRLRESGSGGRAASRMAELLGPAASGILVDPTDARLAEVCQSAGPGTVTVVVGGDGTVNRVLRARRLAAAPGPLAVIPAGTANDLAAALGMPRRWDQAVEAVRAGRTRHIDLLSVNGRPFATCGGLGVAADTAERASRWRESGGLAARACRIVRWGAYPLAAAREFLGPSHFLQARLTCDGGAWDATMMTLLVSNQPRFGGRFAASPAASNADGVFDVCEIDAPPARARMFWILARTLQGRAQRLREVRQFTARALTVETDAPARFFGDGEILAVGSRFDIGILPHALEVVVPAALATERACHVAARPRAAAGAGR